MFDVFEVLEYSGKLFFIEDFDRCYDFDGERRFLVSDYFGVLCFFIMIKFFFCEFDKGMRYLSIVIFFFFCMISV